MNDPRLSGGPVSLANWSKPGMGPEGEGSPLEGDKPSIKCPECGAEFELVKEEKTETPAELPEEGMAA